MLDIYMAGIVIVLTLLMIGLGGWASTTIEEGSESK